MTKYIIADGQYFEKDHQKGVASESEDECFWINVLLLNFVFLFSGKGWQNCLSSNGCISGCN